jgi:hypothetical protein
MAGRDSSERPGPDFPPGNGGSSAGDDVLEQGGWPRPVLTWRPPRVAVVLAAAGLLACLIVGYAAGGWHARHRAAALGRSPAASPVALSAAAALALSQSSGQCSARIGHALLQLGVQVTNQSAADVTLRRVRAALPLGGLEAISQAWGPCGELPTARDPSDNFLPAGASTWFTVTFRVLTTCPGPLPVQFTIDYDWRGRAAATRLPGFADLGQVSYPGCLGS